VANFDEVIVCSEGQIVYSGPIDDVIAYFNELGYEIPEVCVSFPFLNQVFCTLIDSTFFRKSVFLVAYGRRGLAPNSAHLGRGQVS
jgi:hypothetical protein